MNEINNTNKLNELLIQRADNELEEHIRWLLEEAHEDQNQVKTDHDIVVGDFTLPKGTFIPQVLMALKRAIFEKHCEYNRARYISEWLEKVNKTSDSLKKLHGVAQ